MPIPSSHTDPGAELPAQRSLLQLMPRRNLRRALFLVVALLAVLFIKYGGGNGFNSLFNVVAPAPAAKGGNAAPATFHLKVVPSAGRSAEAP